MPSVIKMNESVPQSVENIILKATAKNPKNRYNNVRELYDDLKTCQDKSRKDEKRITFKYPENEYDDENTKVVSNLKEDIKEKEKEARKAEELDVKEIDDDEYTDKKLSKFTKILIALVGVMVFALFAVFIIFPAFTTGKSLKVPDVSGLPVAEARKTLEKKGLKVDTSIKEDYTEDIEKGLISKTKPKAGSSVKKGALVVMFKSAGSQKVKIEDYVGQDSNKIQAKLEVAGLNVLIENKDVENRKDYEGKETIIIDQSVKKGTTLAKGDSITLYIPNLPKQYPSFIKEGYSVKQVQSWCNQYKIILTIEEEESDSTPGTIIYQSRPEGSDVVEGADLSIKVAKKRAEVTPTPTDDTTNTTQEDQTGDNTN
jgi:serine/threonine-protein kinase